ncbi:MAG TPA: methyltransferase domain-containing protein [Phycisphaerae bacterium]|nr:methyltransferase domain-containing protein [Phycisphaerales bacterium]HRX84048.1 methyltransferase domain-containing protein [Phycisphaerae bacterium]
MRRDRQSELMDDPAVEPGAHRRALAALRRVNRWLGVERRLVRAIGRTVAAPSATILDVGTGGGGLVQCARRHGLSWRVCALDRAPLALHEVRSGAAPDAPACVAGDALRLPFADRSVDVVACSLLLHHFDPADAEQLLREAARVCRQAVVIGDLDRTRLAWVLTWLVTRLTSRSHIFHVDGPRSVRAAYRPDEARSLAERAGLSACHVRSDFPFRWILHWRRAA